ncbi:helicase-like transcription factor [Hippocampus comes]|uniref:helicase-like transcription factor n=1 Tax=Hippocampus comes TaxID=109280 RepID=UPI00094E8CFE|nr:PREDICTED: helicase-like transcription factor [Hippocampus comes]
MPVILSFWGKEENKSAVIQRLACYGYKLITGANQKLSSSGAGMALNKRGMTVLLTAEELKNAFDNLFEGLLESKDGEKEAAEV